MSTSEEVQNNQAASNAIPWTPLTPADEKPFYFDTTPLYSLTDAMTAVGRAVENLMGEQTDLISAQMGNSASLVGPLSSEWSDYWEEVLASDEKQIAGANGNQQTLATWTNQFNLDNSGSSASATGYGNILSSLSQQISSMSSNYQNLAQLANTVVTGLASAIVQDWVI